MSKRSPLRASDLTPKAMQRMAAEFLASRNTDSPWPEISRDAWISERIARRWVSTEMTSTAQHERHGHDRRSAVILKKFTLVIVLSSGQYFANDSTVAGKNRKHRKNL
jgi:hypothetical protein